MQELDLIKFIRGEKEAIMALPDDVKKDSIGFATDTKQIIVDGQIMEHDLPSFSGQASNPEGGYLDNGSLGIVAIIDKGGNSFELQYSAFATMSLFKSLENEVGKKLSLSGGTLSGPLNGPEINASKIIIGRTLPSDGNPTLDTGNYASGSYSDKSLNLSNGSNDLILLVNGKRVVLADGIENLSNRLNAIEEKVNKLVEACSWYNTNK